MAAKSRLVSELVGKLDCTSEHARAVLQAIAEIASEDLGLYDEFVLPNVVKLTVKNKPARAARMGRNPATGAPMMIEQKPATTVVKARVLKPMKDSV